MKIYWYQNAKNVIGPAVKELRKSLKMTQKELSNQMQLHGVAIDELSILRIEKGHRFVTDYEVFTLAKIFQVSIESLYPDSMRDNEELKRD